MMRSKLSIASFVSLVLVAACGGAPAAPAATPAGEHGKAAPAASANVKEPGDAKIGDTTKCPVSGEEFVVDASSPKVEHGGKTYYMCCGGCKKKFEADPAKYLKKS
jgi:YHS domain-containing protein